MKSRKLTEVCYWNCSSYEWWTLTYVWACTAYVSLWIMWIPCADALLIYVTNIKQLSLSTLLYKLKPRTFATACMLLLRTTVIWRSFSRCKGWYYWMVTVWWTERNVEVLGPIWRQHRSTCLVVLQTKMCPKFELRIIFAQNICASNSNIMFVMHIGICECLLTYAHLCVNYDK
jgi:hypothetical protein